MDTEEPASNHNRIKEHFCRHQKLYLGIAIGVAASCVVIHLHKTKVRQTISIGYGATVGDITFGDRLDIHVARKIHPGYVLQCQETQIIFPSIRAAAKSMGLSYKLLLKHAKGLISDVDGFHFDVLGDAQAPV